MKDTSKEIENLQRRMIMKLSSDERIEIACEMYISAREAIIASLPKNLSAAEFKRLLYERTYGEKLPKDFPLEN